MDSEEFEDWLVEAVNTQERQFFGVPEEGMCCMPGRLEDLEAKTRSQGVYLALLTRRLIDKGVLTVAEAKAFYEQAV